MAQNNISFFFLNVLAEIYMCIIYLYYIFVLVKERNSINH